MISQCIASILQQSGHTDIACKLLRAGANPDITCSEYGSAREVAERNAYVDIVLALDRHKCRRLLVDLSTGLYSADFPVLVVLEIHDALCSINGLHVADFRKHKEWRSLREGHLKESVSWEIAKKVKHYLD